MNKASLFVSSLLCMAILAPAQTCNNPQGVYGFMASLANTVANEVGRWQPMTDLAVQNDKIVLTAAAKARCATRYGNCANTEAILTMQEDYIANYYDQNVFNPVIFRQRLVIQYQRQQIAAMRPLTDVNRSWAPPHTLNADGVEILGTCGPHFWYRTRSDSTIALTPDHLCKQLIFAGSQGMMSGTQCVADNPYLDMRVTPTATGFDVAIDPIDELVNTSGAALPSGQTVASCLYIDVTGSAAGHSCVCNGVQGTLRQIGDLQANFACK